MIPRPYQEEALQALDTYLCTKPGNPCVVIPTGGGKSLLIAWSIQRWREAYPPFRVIVLAHRKELVQQNADEFRAIYETEGSFLSGDIGIFSAGLGRKEYGPSVLFASIDSVYRRSGDFEPFNLIMVDEAHRIPMRGEGKYLTFLRGCQRFNPNLRVVGWTATPFRMNTGPICHKDHLLNEICYEAKVTDLITDGYLCNLRSKVGQVAPDLCGVKRRGGEYITPSLSQAVNKGNIVTSAVCEAVDIIRREDRKSIVFFCVDVAHCHAISEELAKCGIFAPAVTNKTKPEVRTRIGEDFKRGKLSAVCNVGIYTEGYNATCIDCIVLLRPTLSPGLYSQMVGRGLRIHPDKRFCLILDFASCIDEHGPIDLLGGSGRTVLAICSQCRESFSRALGICPACGWVIPKREIERLEAAEERKRRMHGDKASDREILSILPETFAVDDVLIGRHKKTGKPDSLLVRYRCGMKMFREWICLDHDGYAGEKAQAWWQKRFGESSTVDGALENMFTRQTIKDWTQTVTVKQSGKYKEVIDYNRSIA